MTSTTITVSDMHCGACVNKLRRALSDLGSVRSISANPARRQLFITHDDVADVRGIVARIEDAGFHPVVASLGSAELQDRQLLKRLGVAGLAMMQVMMAAVALYAGEGAGDMAPAYVRLLELTSLLFAIPVVCYSAVPFYRGALQGLRSGLNMDVPVALAILLAFCASLYATVSGEGRVYYDSVVMFAFLLLGARYLDSRLRQQFEGEDQLLKSLPREVGRIASDGLVERVPLGTLAPGDIVRVDEGEQVPVDGELLDDAAYLDEAILTGESVAVAKARLAPVYAGTYNRGAALRLRMTAVPGASRLADIARLADQAALGKPAGARLAERIVAVFIPAILTIATLTYLGWQFVAPEQALSAALAVLVISCPCALSLATPAAFSAAMVRLRRGGIVLTRSDALDRLHRVTDVLFDKTGTLTQSGDRIVDVQLPGTWDESTARSVAAGLESYSAHPLAAAFQALAQVAEVEQVRTLAGRGIEGLWNGQRIRIGSAAFCEVPEAVESAAASGRRVYLTAAGVLQAIFVLEEALKPDAAATVGALRAQGLNLTMLSGDRAGQCARLAEQLGLACEAEALPETKLESASRRQAEGAGVMFVGDGINDIPVLARSDVSVAMLEASDLVRSRADVLLLTRRLAALPLLWQVAGRTRRIMRQNLAWALGYNLIGIPAAAFGLAPPWFAALGMASSSLLVMLNALRVLRTDEASGALKGSGSCRF